MACQSSNLKTSPSSLSSASSPSAWDHCIFRLFASVNRSPPTKMLDSPSRVLGTNLEKRNTHQQSIIVTHNLS